MRGPSARVMRGIRDIIREHDMRLQHGGHGPDFPDLHLRQISFLQHERMAHLAVLCFVVLLFILFLTLHLLFDIAALLVVSAILLILSLFYIVHYFRLENALIRWHDAWIDIHIQGDAVSGGAGEGRDGCNGR